MKYKYFIFGLLVMYIFFMMFSLSNIFVNLNETIYIKDVNKYSENMTKLKNRINEIDDQGCQSSFKEMVNRINDTHVKDTTIKLKDLNELYYSSEKSFLTYYTDVLDSCNIEEDNTRYVDVLKALVFPEVIHKRYNETYQIHIREYGRNSLEYYELLSYTSKQSEMSVLKQLLDKVGNKND